MRAMLEMLRDLFLSEVKPLTYDSGSVGGTQD